MRPIVLVNTNCVLRQMFVCEAKSFIPTLGSTKRPHPTKKIKMEVPRRTDHPSNLNGQAIAMIIEVNIERLTIRANRRCR